MASRYASRQAASASSSPAPTRRSLAIAQPVSTASPQLQELRRQWKWAAVSQFLYTFAQLIALEDVSLVDVEEDLVNSTMIVIPRLMQRLLVTLSQDRKITVDNWQSALRRQYLKRDPAANPIGVEPTIPRNSRAATVETDIKSEERDSVLPDDVPAGESDNRAASVNDQDENSIQTDTERKSADVEASDVKATEVIYEDDDASKKGEQTTQSSVRDWTDLTMLEKLESIHTLIEWHFQSPLRLRQVMRSDDENASWRIEPIGYDAKRNAYWLIGHRLWIQRVPPKPPKKSAKRKTAPTKDNRKAKVARVEQQTKNKKRKEMEPVQPAETPKSKARITSRTPQRTRRASRQPATIDDVSSSPGGSGRARAAKTQANVKLDLQAKQLAAVKAEMEALNRKSAAKNSPTKPPSRRTIGVRMSRRLRGGGGDDDDEEWQPIPDEWLSHNEEAGTKPVNPSVNGSATRKSTRNTRQRKEAPRPVIVNSRVNARSIGLESDDESDLTELSESEESNPKETIQTVEEPLQDDEDVCEPKAEEIHYSPDETLLPPGFIEWETICVSLQEWEEISHRFEKATHYLEKALHKILVQEVVPYVTESLRELEKQRAKEDALMNRKRSSRIAIREMEKETVRQESARRAEEDEKMARLRRVEARARREEEERLQRERAREQRRKEREERELARIKRQERESVEEEVDISSERQPNGIAKPMKNPPSTGTSKASRRRSRKQADAQSGDNENWELDCEICGSKGINRDDGVPLMSCGKCNKWQHINCHDAIDRKAGRPLRDWDSVDFFCKRCRASQKNSDGFHGVPIGYVPRPLTNPDHRVDGRRIEHHGSSGLTNGYGGPPKTDNAPPSYQRLPGITSFTGFSHYQPQQRGFSPHPSVPHYQFYPQTSADSHLPPQSPLARESLGAWNPYSQNTSHTSQGFDQSNLAQSSQAPHSGTTRSPSSYHNQQPYGMGLEGSSLHGSTPPVQYHHTYFTPAQQRIYNNPASHHPQA